MSLDQTIDHVRRRRRARPAGRRRSTGPARIGLALRRLPRPRLRLILAAALLAGLLAGGWLLLRDSSFVAVRTVTITGATTSAGPRIEEALTTAGRGMTTLHVQDAALQRAVAGYPSVAALRVRTDFPHRLIIDVIERRPVAAISAGDQLVAVTGSGLMLRDIDAPANVPEIQLATVPGQRVTDRKVLGALQVAAAAPPALLARTTAIGWGRRGLNAELENGPPLFFGAPTDAAAKWAGAARVLAEPSAAGATYLDLRIPGRVAAGGVGPVADQSATDSATIPQTTAPTTAGTATAAPTATPVAPTPTPTAIPSTVG